VCDHFCFERNPVAKYSDFGAFFRLFVLFVRPPFFPSHPRFSIVKQNRVRFALAILKDKFFLFSTRLRKNCAIAGRRCEFRVFRPLPVGPARVGAFSRKVAKT